MGITIHVDGKKIDEQLKAVAALADEHLELDFKLRDPMTRSGFKKQLLKALSAQFDVPIHTIGYGPPGEPGDVEITECFGCDQELPCLLTKGDGTERPSLWLCMDCLRDN